MPGHKAAFSFRFMFLSLLFVAVGFLCPQPPAFAAARVGNDTVRVGIAQQMPEVKLTFQGCYRLVDALSGGVIAETSPGETWTAANTGGLVMLKRNNEHQGLYQGSIIAEEVKSEQSILSGDGTIQKKNSLSGLAVLSAGTGLNYLGDSGDLRALDGSGRVTPMSRGGLNLFSLEKYGQASRYRGSVEIRSIGAGLTVVNELPVEQYLYGVVPAEMPVSFPLEALKAQAVTARTYVIAQLGSYGSQGFDVLDNQQNQVYRGYDGEHAQAARAVDETAGKVLIYGGRPIAAFFHSSSGGCTENSEDVWSESLGYIRARVDPADYNTKYHNWTVAYSTEQLTRVVNEKLKGLSNPVPYPEFALITDLNEMQLTSSGQRVKRILIEGFDAAGNPVRADISNADRVRIALGLNSSLFSMQKDVDISGRLCGVVIIGSGLGHGLGMSQWGASGLALQGYNYQDILQYYYTGVDLVNNYGA